MGDQLGPARGSAPDVTNSTSPPPPNPPPRGIRDAAPTPFLTQGRPTIEEWKAVVNRIKAVEIKEKRKTQVLQVQVPAQDKEKSPQDVQLKYLKPATSRKQEKASVQEQRRYPSLNITPITSQARSLNRELQPLLITPPSRAQHAPGLKPQSNHSRPYHRKGTANPLRQSSRRPVSVPKNSSAPDKPQLITDQPLLEGVKYVASHVHLKKATKTINPEPTEPSKPDKSTKPTNYGPGHLAFPTDKPSKPTFVGHLKAQITKNKKPVTTWSTISDNPEREVVLNELPQDTKDATEKDVGLQQQIITKAGSTLTKASSRPSNTSSRLTNIISRLANTSETRPKTSETLANNMPKQQTGPKPTFILPHQRNLRACMVCTIILPQSTFHTQGCPNCEHILELIGEQEKIAECTSTNFNGTLAVMDTRGSWVGKWQRLDGYVPGVYAVQVIGTLPDDIIESLRSAGVRYVPRDGRNEEDGEEMES